MTDHAGASAQVFGFRLFCSEAYHHRRQAFHSYNAESSLFIQRKLFRSQKFQSISAFESADAAEIYLSRAVSPVCKYKYCLLRTCRIPACTCESKYVLINSGLTRQKFESAVFKGRVLVIQKAEHPVVISEIKILKAPRITASVCRIGAAKQACLISVIKARDSRQTVLQC